MTMMYAQYAWVVPLLPLIAFIFVMTLGRAAEGGAVWTAIVASASSWIISIFILQEQLSMFNNDYSSSISWFKMGAMQIHFGIEVTQLTALLLCAVSLLHACMLVYSAVYMSRDGRAGLFCGYLSLLGFAMMGLVLAADMLTLFVCWQLLGLASVLLIGFWHEASGVKATVLRIYILAAVGDMFLLLALLLLFWYMPEHALDFASIQNVFEGQTANMAKWITALIAALIVLAAAVKSGLFPFHLWLQSLGKIPLPAKAAMLCMAVVPAGTVLLLRAMAVVQAAPLVVEAAAWLGGALALSGAVAAAIQRKLARVAGYAAMSQMGFMLLGVGVQAEAGTVYLLIGYSVAGSLLLLGRGALQPGVDQGGPWRSSLPTWAMGIGLLSLAGLPPFPGFWAYQQLLYAVRSQHVLLFAVTLAALAGTAFYTGRAVQLLRSGRRLAAVSGATGRIVPVMLALLLVLLAVAELLLGKRNGLFWWLQAEAEPYTASVWLPLLLASGCGLYLAVFRRRSLTNQSVQDEVEDASWAAAVLDGSARWLGSRLVQGLDKAGQGLHRLDESILEAGDDGRKRRGRRRN